MSQINIFYVPKAGCGDEQAELNGFLRAHRTISIERAFTGEGWSFCVEWVEGAGQTQDGWKNRRVDYRKELPPEQFECFARMRERRKEAALKLNIPPYAIITDEQMAQAVRDGEPTIETLKALPSFGEKRAEKYGALLLGLDKPDS